MEKTNTFLILLCALGLVASYQGGPQKYSPMLPDPVASPISAKSAPSTFTSYKKNPTTTKSTIVLVLIPYLYATQHSQKGREVPYILSSQQNQKPQEVSYILSSQQNQRPQEVSYLLSSQQNQEAPYGLTSAQSQKPQEVPYVVTSHQSQRPQEVSYLLSAQQNPKVQEGPYLLASQQNQKPQEVTYSIASQQSPKVEEVPYVFEPQIKKVQEVPYLLASPPSQNVQEQSKKVVYKISDASYPSEISIQSNTLNKKQLYEVYHYCEQTCKNLVNVSCPKTQEDCSANPQLCDLCNEAKSKCTLQCLELQSN